MLGRGREGGLSGPAGPPAIPSKHRGNSYTLGLSGGYSPANTDRPLERLLPPPHGVRALVLASRSFLGNGFVENHTTTNGFLVFLLLTHKVTPHVCRPPLALPPAHSTEAPLPRPSPRSPVAREDPEGRGPVGRRSDRRCHWPGSHSFLNTIQKSTCWDFCQSDT